MSPLLSLHRALFILATAGLAACSSSESVTEIQPHPVLVMTVGDNAAGLATERRVPGVVTARYASDLGFQAAGRLAKRSVELGQRVRQGQVLMQLDASDYRLASQAAQDQVALTKTQFQQADTDAKRFQQLVEAGAISVVESERQTARADAAKAQYLQAQRQARLAHNRLRYASLIAPYDGVITAINAEAGQVVAEGVPVVSMAKPGELELAADIPEALVDSLSSRTAQADVWGLEGAPLALSLRELAPSASQPLRTYRARFAIAKATSAQRAQLHLGMSAQVLLQSAAPSATANDHSAEVTLPATALVKNRDRVSVWLVNDATHRLTKQPVTVHRFTNEFVAVSGVPTGAKVVIAGVQKLDAALPVRAVERTGAGLTLPGNGVRP